ncbi:cytochrome P450 [Frankia sp. Mgl5]|uniref:cytochrome P450 n=1 Tax=Frankia sp. Mgl5 TaxID=2933793 RepID=UPI00200D2E5C|nr:cytochrome P450 [Frankia sp. Mgl5]MCK9930809.1 cytochrome P450 [Frankia sp. Mgl5]
MTEAIPTVHTLPMTRNTLFDPADDLADLRKASPVARFAYPDGHLGWLITGYAAARAVLADPAFSSRRELQHFPIPHPMMSAEPAPAEPGSFPEMDPPEHTRYRRLLTSQFTARRMAELTPTIERIVADHLDAMDRAGSAADLVQAFALPVPSLVICELLGVPYDDRDQFQSRSLVMVNMESTPEQTMSALGGLRDFVRGLVRAKRAEPTDDLLGSLATASGLDDEELTTIGLSLLFAGHGLTGNMLALGTFALLEHPEQLRVFTHGPGLVDSAVEELLRYLTIVHIGPTRTALQDVELEGQLIRAGETVTLSLPAANRDPDRFDDPDTLDVTRGGRAHLALGHGLHQCLGQELARIQMRVAYPALFSRFPTLRLAVPKEEVPMRRTMAFYGVHSLPVAWN